MVADSPFPRKGSALYPFVSGKRRAEERSLRWFRRLNRFLVAPLYRVRLLPLLGVGRIILLLTTRGRRTGRTRRTPLEYRVMDGVIHVFSARGRRADWLRNMRANPEEVKVQVGFREYRPVFELVDDDEKPDLFRFYVTEYPRAARMLLGWNPGIDDPETADFSSLVRLMEIVRLKAFD